MKIVHLSTTDASGGAARAAWRLHTGLQRIGQESTMCVAQRTSDEPGIVQISRETSVLKTLQRMLRRLELRKAMAPYSTSKPNYPEPFSDDRTEYAVDLKTGIPKADIINLHWIAGFIDFSAFFGIYGNRVPIVWTLHDMNPFTGGCHYDGGCDKYLRSCGACPQLGSQKEQDLSREIWTRKQDSLRMLSKQNLEIVADSEWLAGEARRSSLFRDFPIRTVHYGLDTEVFIPRDKYHIRCALGLSQESRIVMFAADSVTNQRKGLSVLEEALGLIPDRTKLVLLSVGKGSPGPVSGIQRIHFGQIANDFILSLLYSAADVFVMPSIQEAFGQSALEAMACGVPVIASKAGGLVDFVKEGENGLMVSPGSAKELANALSEFFHASSKLEDMRGKCRQTVTERFSLEAQARAYESLYSGMLKNGSWKSF